MYEHKTLNKNRNKNNIKRTAAVITLLIMLMSPFIVCTSASAEDNSGRGNVMTLSASDYMLYDVFDINSSNYIPSAYNSIKWNWENGQVNWDLFDLYNYRRQIVNQYNNEIIDLVDDFNKLSESDQTNYLPDFNRVVENLCHFSGDLSIPPYSTDPAERQVVHDTLAGNRSHSKGAFWQSYYYMIDYTDSHFETDTAKYKSAIETSYNDFLTVKSKIHEKAASIGEYENSLYLSPILAAVNGLWAFIGDAITYTGILNATPASGGGSYTGWAGAYNILAYNSIEGFVNQYSPLFIAPAYLVFFISFVSNIMESSLKYDIADPKVLIRVFTRVIIGKVFIDGAVQICLLTLQFCNKIAASVMVASANLILSAPVEASYSDTPIIGQIVSLILTFVHSLPMIIFAIVAMISCFKVTVKLITRTFELICLITVSPVFAACLAGENTKKYFERFFVTFLSVAASIIFIAVIYAIGSSVLATANTVGADEWWVSYFGPMIVLVAICQFITKPPKVFSNLLAG